MRTSLFISRWYGPHQGRARHAAIAQGLLLPVDTACAPPKPQSPKGPAHAEQRTQPSRKRQMQVSVSCRRERVPRP